nr:Hypothetical protein [Oryza sativa Japonica Group]AAP52802.1 hypothetical protein LOC_Os10g15120 [Oryza sativa Japonica Group]
MARRGAGLGARRWDGDGNSGAGSRRRWNARGDGTGGDGARGRAGRQDGGAARQRRSDGAWRLGARGARGRGHGTGTRRRNGSARRWDRRAAGQGRGARGDATAHGAAAAMATTMVRGGDATGGGVAGLKAG